MAVESKERVFHTNGGLHREICDGVPNERGGGDRMIGALYYFNPLAALCAIYAGVIVGILL